MDGMEPRRLRWGIGPMVIGGLALTYGLYAGISVSADPVGRTSGMAFYLGSAFFFVMGTLVLVGIWPVDNT
ncbi:hypothetical protein SAMN05421858_4633 [Haladaptatus litoreus]|uniref:Uncharacterized protein n=1 Tax=Haladaptatus litoreus TaxID=553468 RepID=A0A1N7EYH9_9EURY|nr:hypothetical protein SAMN05421858_4633 [Haladaptatus litoreus]